MPVSDDLEDMACAEWIAAISAHADGEVLRQVAVGTQGPHAQLSDRSVVVRAAELA